VVSGEASAKIPQNESVFTAATALFCHHATNFTSVNPMATASPRGSKGPPVWQRVCVCPARRTETAAPTHAAKTAKGRE